ncbi:tryptophan 2,3-dioxygenase [Cognaticolwellia beringensis]|uniref:Tryptophan 2,3-dioxygenase n=1 Tax=Cognaticolwellia beringensis TaxID=1967665 RepID=A0A222G5Q9_9GAMM|nr:tryptophan 2,3-dioxygenase family protein [Cognaticolwellia beringensis]ASP46923.1 tryptophan 2,3-dioxygenase [Cognaticolwellia beringensis]
MTKASSNTANTKHTDTKNKTSSDSKASGCPFHHQANDNTRPLEDGIHQNLDNEMSYRDYLQLESVLSAQKPLSGEHDEMLFIIIHQTSELWLKLAGHELQSAIDYIKAENFGPAFKVIARVKQIFMQLTQSWNILSTLTPSDYLKFRDDLGRSSGIQSCGYRKLEFLLGNKSADMLKIHPAGSSAYQELDKLLNNNSLYDEVIIALAKAGFDIDPTISQRDITQPYQRNDSVLAAWLNVYQQPETYFELYELAEKLVDIEDAFQQWRFKHMYTVQRIIGYKKGTGGSSGVGFLKKALDVSFFPELFEVRTHL